MVSYELTTAGILIMPNYNSLPYAIETFEQAFRNTTAVVQTSIETVEFIGSAASSATTLLTITNITTKALSLGYGISLTVASAN